MQSRWCRAWSRPNLTDFVHIFSKRGYLQCVFVHWRDLETKSKSTAYLLENWNSSTMAPDALFSPWWASMASSDRPCCSSWSCFRCAAALSACTFPAYPPTLGKSSFSPHEGFWCRRSTALSSSLVSNLGESTVKETNRSFDRSRSEFADPRYRPRGRITKSVTVTTTYNRTMLSGPQPRRNTKWRRPRYTLRHHYRARNWTFEENHFLVSS